ncbi:MAG: hypothetical protein ACLPM3_06070 [Terracidiphilus sp.]
MSSQTVMSLLMVTEFALWAAFGFLFWTRNLHRRFPAMGFYLALRVVSMPVFLVFFYGQERQWFNGHSSNMYFYFYWAVYIASAVLLFFVCIEVFRSALSAFSGLQRLGTVVFRWAALASVIVSLSTLNLEHSRTFMMTHIATGLMRSVSILELCLLAFLCLSMNALRLSVRDMAFGISLGFGLMSANDFIVGALLARNTSLTGPLQFAYESVILVLLGIWITYATLPEPARQPLVMPVNSTILRWNEIASVLGYTGTQVAVQPAGGFVLTDVERVAERMPIRNLRYREEA